MVQGSGNKYGKGTFKNRKLKLLFVELHKQMLTIIHSKYTPTQVVISINK